MVEIRLRNSRSRSVETLRPLDPAQGVRMYLCGPTVYDRAHLGNARPSIMFDVLYRLLRHVSPGNGWAPPVYVRNFTDVDDKINARAAETGRSIGEITEETIGWYRADMGALGCLAPTHEPRATAYIAEMIAMIEGLIADGHAYPAEGHVLFRVRSFAAYGALSGRSVDDMIAGARVEVAPFKEDPMDFVLWKPSSGDLPGWDSPWGRGRPGWHIECSAMSKALLGETFDIHGGGNDLLFPHHENEIAQSCCANHTEQMAQIWLHNEMLLVEGKKMSKSLGNFFTVRDLLDQGVPGKVIRFVFLSTHYSKPMDWTEKKRDDARRHLHAWNNLKSVALSDRNRSFSGEGVDTQIIAALADDLNTSLAIARLFELALEAKRSSEIDSPAIIRFFESLAFLGFTDLDIERDNRRASIAQSLIKANLNDLAKRLETARTTALQTKDFTEVDALKSALTAAGVEVRMSKEGVELIPGPGFDPAKLEGL
ncbi:MAG: cysteine--tRNA ligase [Roseicyclus sp.]|uniref:cysteine--tRNA ligase n=1 Tax=Roseicyclus sp. TaxID=1914329 RepID=UPI003A8AA37D